MNKKILALLVVIIIVALTITVIKIKQKRAQGREAVKLELLQKFQLIKSQFDKAKALGLNVTEVEELGKQAKIAFDSGDYAKTSELVKNILASLNKAGVPEPTPGAAPTPARSNIPTPASTNKSTPAPTNTPISILTPNPIFAIKDFENIKNVVIYERIIGKRPVDESISLLLKANPDFIFRGFFKMDSNWGYGKDTTLYDQLTDAISKLKEKKPSIIFQGALNIGYLDPGDTWADGTPLSEDDIKDMILYVNGQPIKRDRPWLPKGYDYEADIANPKYRDYIVSWSEKQIDAGVDSIFYDEIMRAPGMRFLKKSINQNELKNQFDNYENVYWKDIVDRVKAYAASKNRTIYITANQPYNIALKFHPWKYVDIVTIHIEKADFLEMRVSEDWNLLKEKAMETNGKDLPIMIFIDWGNDPNQGLGLFAKMNQKDQVRFLEILDKSAMDNGILLAYPMHGGEPGFKKDGSMFNGVYDSIEYGTYDTIVKLAKQKQ